MWMRWWWWWSCTFANTRQERVLRAKSHETKHNGSVLGVPCETVVEGNEWRWWGGVNEVVAVVGLCVCKCEVGEGAGVKNPKLCCHSSTLSCIRVEGGFCVVTAPPHDNLWGVGTWE